jgi:hypothetical protein
MECEKCGSSQTRNLRRKLVGGNSARHTLALLNDHFTGRVNAGRHEGLTTICPQLDQHRSVYRIWKLLCTSSRSQVDVVARRRTLATVQPGCIWEEMGRKLDCLRHIQINIHQSFAGY